MIEALGYVGIATEGIADWADYGEGWMGLQLVERTAGTLRFRMDDRKQRFIVSDHRSLPEGSSTAQFFGWEVTDSRALDALATRLEKAGVAARPMSRALCDHRRIAAGITFRDPAGNVLEAFNGGEVTSDPFVPGRHISGFRTGALGMGHAVLRCRDVEPMIASTAMFSASSSPTSR